MSKSQQKLTPVERLRGEAKILANQLARANTHLHFFRSLLKHYPKFATETDFWDYTLTAHSGMVIRDVGVIFDTHKKGINLVNLLGLIDPQPLDIANGKRLPEFLAVVGKLSPDPNVRILRAWRNNIVAHYNNEIAWTDREDFSKQNPLDEAKLQLLIDKGFEVVEWCAQTGGQRVTFPRLAPGKDGHETVLEKLRGQSRS